MFPRPRSLWLQIYLLIKVGNVGTFILPCSVMMFWSRSDGVIPFFALIFSEIDETIPVVTAQLRRWTYRRQQTFHALYVS